jgi:UDP-glucose:(glucosyl)LPS alpha-1,2-glucosyltransferase
MGLTIIDDREVTSAKGPSKDGTYTKAQGGTELMNSALYKRVDNELLEKFFIIKSRVRHLDKEKPNILWLHDLWSDPEVQNLKKSDFRNQFAQLVFVSNWQLQTYNLTLGVPYSNSIVLKNAIDPIEFKAKERETIRLIYHTTPHRGLQIVVPVVEALAKKWGKKIHLDVYSSFEAYGWPERDEPYLDLFEQIKQHPQMTYHGFQPNDVVRKALQRAHIFAYPSIWQETSCIAAIEAMSAGCEVVCPNYAALPETTAGYATMYQWSEDMNHHANVFAQILNMSIENHVNDTNGFRFQMAKQHIDKMYNWDARAEEWTGLLKGLEKKFDI